MATLTTANSAFTITVQSPAFPVPVQIQGYNTDDAFDTDNVAPNEAVMGVDGNLSAGHTPYPVKLKFQLMADSLSNDFMDLWRQTEDQLEDTLFCNATIVAPSLGKSWNFIKGALTGAMPTPPGKKRFQAQTYELTFKRLITAPV